MKKSIVTNTKRMALVTILAVITIGNNVFAQKKQVVSSKVTFKIKNTGIYVDGSLSGLEADINFNPKDLKNSKIVASVKTETINTNSEGRDKHLKKDDYFGVAKYPKITFVTSNFAESQSGNFIGYFDVTIKDKTKKVTVPFSYKNNVLLANFTINRLDFGVGEKSMILGDEVKITLEVTVQ